MTIPPRPCRTLRINKLALTALVAWVWIQLQWIFYMSWQSKFSFQAPSTVLWANWRMDLLDASLPRSSAVPPCYCLLWSFHFHCAPCHPASSLFWSWSPHTALPLHVSPHHRCRENWASPDLAGLRNRGFVLHCGTMAMLLPEPVQVSEWLCHFCKMQNPTW